MEHILDRNSDVVFLTETWLQSDKNAVTAEIQTYGYKLLHNRRKDREKDRGGGVGILVKSSYMAKQIPAKQFLSFEHTVVRVPVAKKTLYLISVYRVLFVAVSVFMEEFSELLGMYTIPNEHYVIAGDFNIHVESDDSNAKQLKELLDMYDLHQHISSPTHNKGHTLDLVITSRDPNLLTDVNVTEIDLSHHYLIDFKLTTEIKTLQQKVVTYRSTKNVDMMKFNEDVQNRLNTLPPTRDLATKVENYNVTLTQIVQEHTCMKTRTMKIVPDAPWFDADYANLRKLRRNAEKSYRRSGLDSDKKLYSMLRKQTTQSAFDKKKTFVKNRLAQGNSCRTLYSVANNLIDNKKEVVLPKSASDKELANRFQVYFKEKVEKIRASFNTQPGTRKALNPHIDQLSAFRPTNVEEIKEIIKNYSIKCSPEDPVPLELLAPNIETFIPYWVDIVNLSLESGSMDKLKSGVLNPLIKELSATVDTDDFKNYRPVTNLVIISKLIERVVQVRLEEHMIKNNLVSTKNYAYKKGHSTELLLLKVVNDLYKSFDNNMPSVVVLLDLSAAFDTVDHDKLLEILEMDIGITGTALRWFESFLKGRTQRVKIGSSYSDPVELLYGVAQGSVLGPSLFKIYIRSLYKYVEPTKFRIEGFADDHQLIKQFLISLQPKALGADIVNCLNHIGVWMNEYFLKLNPTKTKILILAPPSVQPEIIIRGVFLENECIRFVRSAKNLGVILDSELSFADQINRIVKSSFLIIKKLSQIKGFLSEDELKQLVCSYVFLTIDYCNSLYYGINSNLTKKLQHVQNCAARLVSKNKIPSGGLEKVIMDFHWLRVKYRPIYKLMLIVHNCIQQRAPDEIQDMIIYGDSRRTMKLQETKYNNKYGNRAFSRVGPKLWNLLPKVIREEADTESFKKALKSFLMLRGEEFCSWVSMK